MQATKLVEEDVDDEDEDDDVDVEEDEEGLEALDLDA